MTVSIKYLEMQAAENAIKMAGEQLGLNLKDVASALGVHRRTLCRYKNHENAPSSEVCERLTKLLEISQLLKVVFSDKDSQLICSYGPVPMLRGQRPY